ncbi:Uncharacterised protein [Vibrio cholerae]|nr:Uncharacterised protein [Vibrio cholerae]
MGRKKMAKTIMALNAVINTRCSQGRRLKRESMFSSNSFNY